MATVSHRTLGSGSKWWTENSPLRQLATGCPNIPHQSVQSIIHSCFPCLYVHVSAYVVPSKDRPSNAPALTELPLHCLYRGTVCTDGRRQCNNAADVVRLYRTAKATILAFVMTSTPLSATLIYLTPHRRAFRSTADSPYTFTKRLRVKTWLLTLDNHQLDLSSLF